MKADCERYREDLAALRRGEETGVPEAELRAHLAACAGCAEHHERSGRLFTLLDELQPGPAPDGARRLRLAISTGRYRPGPAAPAPRRAASLPVAALAAAAAFLLALGIGGRLDWGRSGRIEKPEPAAVLTSLSGAEASAEEGEAPRAGQVLASGAVLRLAPEGRARLVLHRGAEVELAGGSTVEVLAGDRLLLQSGKLLAVVRKGATPLVVRTPGASVATLGTRFIVEARGGATRLTVIEGRVVFFGGGELEPWSLEVAGGQTAEAAGGLPPPAPTAARAENLAWPLAARRPELDLELALGKSRVRPGERLTARLRLLNRSRGTATVDGTGRGRSSYFLRLEDPSGGRSHFSPAVLAARAGGALTRAPVIQLAAGEAYELELDLGRLPRAPGRYLVTAIYLESAASGSTDWSGTLASRAMGILVEAPPPEKGKDSGGGKAR